MIFELIEDVVKVTLIIASLYFLIGAYVRRKQPMWFKLLEERRISTLLVLILVVVTLKLSEDVLGGESGPIDKAILLFIHSNTPVTLTRFFEIVTFTGSVTFLFPLAALVVIIFVYAKRRHEALIVAASMISGAALVYIVKTLVNRARPALWDTEWYWGSSFPSGHTLLVAAFATSTALCVSRIKPNICKPVLLVTVIWISLVAISRLVLGVHWPTDVLVAACIGAFLPLAMDVALEVRYA